MNSQLIPFVAGKFPDLKITRVAKFSEVDLSTRWPATPIFIESADQWASLLERSWTRLLQSYSDGRRLPDGSARAVAVGSVAPLDKMPSGPPPEGCSVALVDIAAWNQDFADLADQTWHHHRCDRSVSVFWSGPNSSGFNVHYDAFHSVLVQLAGSKRWRVGPGPIASPTLDLGWDVARNLVADDSLVIEEDEAIDVELHQGQALWLPPGWLHAGDATAEGSLHATWGLSPYTAVDLVREVATQAHHLPGLREGGIPPLARAEEIRVAVVDALILLVSQIRSGDFPVASWDETFPT